MNRGRKGNSSNSSQDRKNVGIPTKTSQERNSNNEDFNYKTFSLIN
jgi:hypothetical protein